MGRKALIFSRHARTRSEKGYELTSVSKRGGPAVQLIQTCPHQSFGLLSEFFGGRPKHISQGDTGSHSA